MNWKELYYVNEKDTKILTARLPGARGGGGRGEHVWFSVKERDEGEEDECWGVWGCMLMLWKKQEAGVKISRWVEKGGEDIKEIT